MATREDQLLDPFNKGNGKRPPGLYDYTILQGFTISGSWSGTLIPTAAVVWFPTAAPDAVFLMYPVTPAAVGAPSGLWGGAVTLQCKQQTLILFTAQSNYIKQGITGHTTFAKGRAITGGMHVFSSTLPTGATSLNGVMSASALPTFPKYISGALLQSDAEFDKDVIPRVPLHTGVTMLQGPTMYSSMQGMDIKSTAGFDSWSGNADESDVSTFCIQFIQNVTADSAFFLTDFGWEMVGANYTNYDMSAFNGTSAPSIVSPVSKLSIVIGLNASNDGTPNAYTEYIVHMNHLYAAWNANTTGIEVFSVKKQEYMSTVFNTGEATRNVIFSPIPTPAEATRLNGITVIGTGVFGLATYIGTQFWVEFRPFNSSTVVLTLVRLGYRVQAGHMPCRIAYIEGAENQTINISGGSTWQAVPQVNTLGQSLMRSNVPQEFYSEEEMRVAAEKFGNPSNSAYRKCYPADVYKLITTPARSEEDVQSEAGKKRSRLV